MSNLPIVSVSVWCAACRRYVEARAEQDPQRVAHVTPAALEPHRRTHVAAAAA